MRSLKLSLYVSFGLLCLSACDQRPVFPQKPPIITMEEASASQSPIPQPVYKMTDTDMAQAFSNENVIVYSLSEDVTDNRREFPEYRSVLENTTAGGFTVFDPSVTVFPVEEGANARPSYLPHYSVPQYAQQYRSPAPAVALPDYQAQPLAPVGAPVTLQSPTPIVQARSLQPNSVSRPWIDDQAPVNMPRAPRVAESAPVTDTMISPVTQKQAPARRSPPILTGY